jgi:hypothetical protein
MDPLTSLVTALAAGASAALQSTVEQGVKDGYTALKGLIQRKYAQVDVDQLEANPRSKSRQGVVQEDLATVRAHQDAEVLQYAQALLEAIQRQAPQTAAAIGVDLKDIEGASVAIQRIIATGAGVKVERAKLSGDITIGDVQAGRRGGTHLNPLRAAGLTPAAPLQLDHIIVGHDLATRDVTIQQYFGETRRTDPARRLRRAMIEKVWAIWITGVLQPSLPQDILLELGLTERPAMVARTLDLFVQHPDFADQVQTPGMRLVDTFDRLNRALLILGAPGAGKTTLLLTLARDLLIRAAQDPEQPIPVVFPLSSWAERRRPMADWLVDALNAQYDVPRKTGRIWVNADQILPLLDGLDEVAPEHREACAEAINTFRQEHGLLPLVVCSQVADYEALGVRLQLHGAIVVRPLTRKQIENYLTQVGAPLATVRQVLHEDPTLWELLDTPLMLHVVTSAYAGRPVAALHTGETPEVQRRHLFTAYVERMFQRRSLPTRYTRQQTEHWLAWLAWQMGRHSQTVFSLERMQPDWLPQRQHWVPTHGARLLTGLDAGLVCGLLGGLVFGLLGGLVCGLLGGLTTGLDMGGIPISSICCSASCSGITAPRPCCMWISSTMPRSASSCAKSAAVTALSTGCCKITSPRVIWSRARVPTWRPQRAG